jgi:hypothetical protein
MKRLIAGVFQLIYRITGVKVLAYFAALAYMTVLHLTIFYGMGLLLEDWLPMASIVHTLFRFPLILGTILIMLAINVWFAPSLENITKEGKKIRKFSPIILYSLLSLVVFLYARFYDKIF